MAQCYHLPDPDKYVSMVSHFYFHLDLQYNDGLTLATHQQPNMYVYTESQTDVFLDVVIE